MSYQAIYRTFRPQTFKAVKGQESIVRTLQNQIRNDRTGHAYLFTGTRGTGKTSVARIFAKALNCLSPKDGEPCNECENCRAITAGSFMDVVEIDAASNTGVDDIRSVIAQVQYTPVAGKYKIFIIDEAHMLSGAASNAFLKTLEEPPSYAVFILATTEPHKLPVTILSRCQRYDFKRITSDKIAENIREYLGQEKIEADDKAVNYIARLGDGSMRDALSLLDKAVAFCPENKLTYEDTLAALGTVDTEVFSEIFNSVYRADAFSAVSRLETEVRNGKDITRLIYDLVWYLRNLLLISAGGDRAADIPGLSSESIEAMRRDAGLANADVLMRYIRILSELMNQLRFSGAKQVLADVALIKLARPQMETDTESILDRIRQLEAKTSDTIVQPVFTGAAQQQYAQEASVRQPFVQAPPAQDQTAQQPLYYGRNVLKPDFVPEPVSAYDEQYYNNYQDEPAVNYEMPKNDHIQAFPEIVQPDNMGVQPTVTSSDFSADISAPASRAEPVIGVTSAREAAPLSDSAPAREAAPAGGSAPMSSSVPVSGSAPAISSAPVNGAASVSGGAAAVCSMWPNIVEACGSPVMKVFLKDAAVRAVSENAIDISGISDMAVRRLESGRDELKELIKQTTGFDVEIGIGAKSEQADFQPVQQDMQQMSAEQEEEHIQYLINKNIKMKVETEGA